MTDTRDVLIVISEAEQRTALIGALERREATVHVYDDAMRALAKLGDLNPEAVLVGQDPGPPGAASLCRILTRKRPSARVFRIADPSERDVLGSAAALISPTTAVADIAARLLPPRPGDLEHGLELSELTVESQQFAQVLLTCADNHYSGRLWVTTADAEREVVLLSGMPVATRSTLPNERLGQVALDLKLISSEALQEALSLSRVRGLRLGEALLRHRVLDGYGLHRALCEQHMRRLAALCQADTCTVSFAEETDIAARETLLRVHPLTAMLRALSSVPQVSRAAAFEQVEDLPLSQFQSSRTLDRFLQCLGIHDLSGLLRHARNLGSLKQLVGPALSTSAGVSGEQLCWLLLWSGVLGFGDGARAVADAQQDARLRGLLSLPVLTLSGLWSAPTASPDELPERISEYLFAPATREHARGQFATKGPAAEGNDALADFLAHYYRVKGSRDPLHVLGLVRQAEGEVVHRAYLEAAASLDGLPTGPDPLSVAAKRQELRDRLEWAYGLLGQRIREPLPSLLPAAAVDGFHEDSEVQTVVASVTLDGLLDDWQGDDGGPTVNMEERTTPPEITTMDMGLLREAEQYAEQGRWQEVMNSVVTRYADLSAVPLPGQLLYAVAVRESGGAAGGFAADGPTPEQLSIEVFAKMLGVSADSPTVTILAKRILRRPPASWNQRPSPRMSFLATSMALLAGTAVGLWLQHNAEWSQRMLRSLPW